MLWAHEHRLWMQNQWNSVIFSDESTFQIYIGSQNNVVIRKKCEAFKTDCLKRTVKFPKSIMVWGCMSSYGVGQLCFIDRRVNTLKYQQILERNLIPTMENLSDVENIHFQQDGASSHTATTTKNWLESNGINVLKWCSNSPDLNPIENIWAIMKKELKKQHPTTIDALKRHITQIWAQITTEQCKKLTDSMPNRIEAVLRARGDATKY